MDTTKLCGCQVTFWTKVIALYQTLSPWVIIAYLVLALGMDEWPLGVLIAFREMPTHLTQMDTICIALVCSIHLLGILMALWLLYGVVNNRRTILEHWIHFTIHSSALFFIALLVQGIGSSTIYNHTLFALAVLSMNELCIQVVKLQLKDMKIEEMELEDQSNKVIFARNYLRNILAFRIVPIRDTPLTV